MLEVQQHLTPTAVLQSRCSLHTSVMKERPGVKIYNLLW